MKSTGNLFSISRRQIDQVGHTATRILTYSVKEDKSIQQNFKIAFFIFETSLYQCRKIKCRT